MPLNLKRVTFTGVDDETDPKALGALSSEFPFIEWGVLLSTSKTGTHPRYPALAKIKEFSGLAQHVPFAVHLCGSMARDAADASGAPMEIVYQIIGGAKRVQLNLGSHVARKLPGLSDMALNFGVQIIIQTSAFAPYRQHVNTWATARGGSLQWARAETREEMGMTRGLAFLHDASGGQGIDGTFEKPLVMGDAVGFAGGIAPDNILRKLSQIVAVNSSIDGDPVSRNVWIDMESGVRTDDRFDLEKVRAVCETIAPILWEENAASADALANFTPEAGAAILEGYERSRA